MALQWRGPRAAVAGGGRDDGLDSRHGSSIASTEQERLEGGEESVGKRDERLRVGQSTSPGSKPDLRNAPDSKKKDGVQEFSKNGTENGRRMKGIGDVRAKTSSPYDDPLYPENIVTNSPELVVQWLGKHAFEAKYHASDETTRRLQFCSQVCGLFAIALFTFALSNAFLLLLPSEFSVRAFLWSSLVRCSQLLFAALVWIIHTLFFDFLPTAAIAGSETDLAEAAFSASMRSAASAATGKSASSPPFSSGPTPDDFGAEDFPVGVVSASTLISVAGSFLLLVARVASAGLKWLDGVLSRFLSIPVVLFAALRDYLIRWPGKHGFNLFVWTVLKIRAENVQVFYAAELGLAFSAVAFVLAEFYKANVREARLLVVRGLGIQSSQTLYSGKTRRLEFFPISRVKDIYVHQVFDYFTIVHQLIFLLGAEPEKGVPLIAMAPFEGLQPRLEELLCLLQATRHVCLNEAPDHSIFQDSTIIGG